MAKPKITITGIDKALRQINKDIELIEGATMSGLIRGAIEIRRATETQSPLTPVDLGNLRSSWFVLPFKGGPADNKEPAFVGPESEKHASHHKEVMARARSLLSLPVSLVMGYTAWYAFYVHEDLGRSKSGSKNWNRPGSGPKWFESALKNSRKAILACIVKENNKKRRGGG